MRRVVRGDGSKEGNIGNKKEKWRRKKGNRREKKEI